MWYLIAATISSSLLVIILKLFDDKGVNLYIGITMNYIVGAILSFLFAPIQLPVAEIVSAEWFPISIVIGAMFMLSFVVYAVSAQRSGVAITTISGRAAVVIPVIFAFVVLDEQATAGKIVMLVLILLAMVLILRKTPEQKMERSGGVSFNWVLLLPVAVFLFNGVNDTMVQYAQKTMIPHNNIIPIFTGTMFIGGVVTGLICYGLSLLKNPHKPNIKDLMWGSLLGVVNWVCMIGVFNALSQMDGSLFYPLYYTGAIVISTIVGVWIFKEKLSKINYIGIAIAIAAIAVLSTQ